jgi:hypothetical protein
MYRFFTGAPDDPDGRKFDIAFATQQFQASQGRVHYYRFSLPITRSGWLEKAGQEIASG